LSWDSYHEIHECLRRPDDLEVAQSLGVDDEPAGFLIPAKERGFVVQLVDPALA
jgi:hypothetical protein